MTVERAKNVLQLYGLCHYRAGRDLCYGKSCKECEYNYEYKEYADAARIVLERAKKMKELNKSEENNEG